MSIKQAKKILTLAGIFWNNYFDLRRVNDLCYEKEVIEAKYRIMKFLVSGK